MNLDSLFNRVVQRSGRWPRPGSEGVGELEVTLSDGVLAIEGERKQEKAERQEKFHRVESLYGSFTRSFSLPGNIKAEAISSESKDGVLTVHVPKGDQEELKEIAIQ